MIEEEYFLKDELARKIERLEILETEVTRLKFYVKTLIENANIPWGDLMSLEKNLSEL